MNVPDQWWKSACEKIPYPLSCIGADHKFIWVNAAWCRMLGYDPVELIGEKWHKISHTDDIGASVTAMDRILMGQVDDFALEVKYKKRDGSRVPVAIHVSRFPEFHQQVLCFIVAAEARADMLFELKHELDSLRDEFNRIKNLPTTRIINFIHNNSATVLAVLGGTITLLGTIIGMFYKIMSDMM